MDDYAGVSLHGTLPLTVDPTTGSLRFARPGRDLASECVASPASLPPARFELIAFQDTGHMQAWLAGFRENQPNSAETILPEIDWPWFLLLVRHDREPLPGTTLDETVPLRFAPGSRMSAAAVAKKGGEARARELQKAHRAASEAAFADAWRAELSAVARHHAMAPDMVSSAKQGSLAVNVSTGGILGLGPTVDIRKEPDGGYLACWRLLQIRRESDDEAAARADVAKEGDVIRNGSRFSLHLRTIDEDELERLFRAVCSIENVPQPSQPAPR